MQISLRIALVLYALFLFIIITILLRKGKIPEKYSIVWYAFSVVILLVGIVPNFLEIFSDLLGFEVLSNFVIGILITLITLMLILSSVMIANHRRKINLLIQEVSILKKEIKEKK